MGLSVKDSETERLVRELAARRRTGVTGAIKLAVSNELARDKADIERRMAAIAEIQKQVAKLPVLMSDDEVDAWMYDENGLPH
jgi:antitoxin VapB